MLHNLVELVKDRCMHIFFKKSPSTELHSLDKIFKVFWEPSSILLSPITANSVPTSNWLQRANNLRMNQYYIISV